MLETVINVLGILSAVIMVLVKFKPGMDDYFRKGSPILLEIDDIIDAILLQFPNSDKLKTINQILDKIISELEEAGYKVDQYSQKKIENRLKARLRREGGFKLEFDPQKQKVVVKYEGSF